jgi:AAA+ ATPase superfamily predicted ATPase
MAIAKPRQVFDRDDEWAALTRFADSRSSDVRLGIVSGRRRQGKTYLLRALAQACGAFFYSAAEGTSAELLRDFGGALSAWQGSAVPLLPQTWDDAVRALLDTVANGLIIIDEFPYLAQAYPPLPSLLQRQLDQRTSQAKLLLCGSAMGFMGNLLSGSAPLRGRASLELIVQPFDYLTATAFWEITDPQLAVLTHAVVGGTPAYRREFTAGDTPVDLGDFDDWVIRTVLNPQLPLFREARYLLAEESQLREPALYQTVLAAIAAGNSARGSIASYAGRKSSDLGHALAVLEDARLINAERDAFHPARALYRIAEPLLTFYEAIMRPDWSALEAGEARDVWPDAKPRFLRTVVGPHFEALCREYARRNARQLFGQRSGQVSAGTLSDGKGRDKIEVDVLAYSAAAKGGERSVLSLGEVKWNKVMGIGHVNRLRRAKELLAARGYDCDNAILACYSGGGFTAELLETERQNDVVLIGPEMLYSNARQGHR